MNAEDVKQLIDLLVTNGEILASNVYKIAYRQAVYYGISDLIWMLFFICILYFGIKFLVRLHALSDWDSRKNVKTNNFFDVLILGAYEQDLESIIAIVSIFSIIISIICIPILFACGLNWLVNIEYGAIRVIFSLLPSN